MHAVWAPDDSGQFALSASMGYVGLFKPKSKEPYRLITIPGLGLARVASSKMRKISNMSSDMSDGGGFVMVETELKEFKEIELAWIKLPAAEQALMIHSTPAVELESKCVA